MRLNFDPMPFGLLSQRIESQWNRIVTTYRIAMESHWCGEGFCHAKVLLCRRQDGVASWKYRTF